MAFQPATSGLLGKLMYSGLPQWETATGRTPTAGMVQGLLQADLQGSKQLAMEQNFRERQLALQNQYLQMAKDAEKRQKRKMRIGNVLGAITAPLGLLSMGGAAAEGLSSLGGLFGGGAGSALAGGTTSLAGIQS